MKHTPRTEHISNDDAHPTQVAEALKALEQELPPVVWLKSVDLLPLIGITTKRVKNLIAQGEGPSSQGIVYHGRRVGILREALLSRLSSRLSVHSPHKAAA